MAELRNIKDVRIEGKILTVKIDGVEYTFDLARHSKLLANATLEQCANVEFDSKDYGIHWPDVDEDLSFDGMIRDSQV